MTSAEYLKHVIDGTEQYYDYLYKNGKGKDKVHVTSVCEHDGLYDLTLGGNLYDENNTEFCIHNVSYTAAQLRPVTYDRKRGVLTVWPTDEFILDITAKHSCRLDEIPCDQIVLKSSLLFLVKRVLNWYKKRDNLGLFSGNVPPCEIVSSEHSKISPSPEQARAIKTAMTSSLSYIWGAPGSGKTKFVLARCLLSHIRAGHKVIVCAPTNIALEQSLFGVLNVLEVEGVSVDKVLRLGTPSDRFSKLYPECCVLNNVQRQIEELCDIKEDLIQKVYACQKAKITFEEYKMHFGYAEYAIDISKEMKKAFTLATTREEKLAEYVEESKGELHKLNEMYIEVSDELTRERESVAILTKEKKTLRFRLSNLFGTAYSEDIRKSLALASLKVDDKTEEKNGLSSRIDDVRDEIDQNTRRLRERKILKKALHDCLDKRYVIEELFPKKLAPIIKGINIYNAEERFDMLISAGEELLEDINIYLTEHAGDDALDTSDLECEISEIETQLAELSPQSAQVRIENANVVALTSDQFIGSYELILEMHREIGFDHVFIDEAGYLCAAKGMAILDLGTPVTLLGDHMQLPPVCEMNFDEKTEPVNFPAMFWSLPVIYCCNIFESKLGDLFSGFVTNSLTPFESMPRESLTETFRFGANLARALSEHVYPSPYKVVSASENAETEIIVIDAPRSKSEKQRRENHSEAEAILAYLNSVECDRNNIAVLTPYNPQRKLLTQILPYSMRENILTVHRSQGQEWECVVFSAVDTYNKWFTTTLIPERGGRQVLNTAISRAKRRFVIVCDYEHWMRSPDELLGDIVSHADSVISFQSLI